jgi:integrase
MANKFPRLDHVKYVRSKGKVYAYFDTGEKKGGKPIRAPLPPPSDPSFFDVYAKMKAARSKRAKTEYTIANLARDYEKSREYAARAANTRNVYSKTLIRVVDLLGEATVNELSRGDIQLVLDKEEMGPGAHNMFVAVIGVLYKWARGREKTTNEPTKGIVLIKGAEHEPWPEHILDAALVTDDDRIRLATSLLYFTGQRIGDVLKMRWSDVRDGVVHVVQQKTGKELWIPLLAELAAELAKTPKRGMTIMADEKGRPFRIDRIRKALQAFTADMGQKTVPHGLRKNAVIALLEAGCSVAEVASITGQSYKIVEHYAKRINQRRMAKAAIIKLENKRGTGKRNGKPA